MVKSWPDYSFRTLPRNKNNMKLRENPYGVGYYHIPSGKVIYLQNRYSDGTYSAHFQYQQQMTVHPEDLRYAEKHEIEKYYTYKAL